MDSVAAGLVAAGLVVSAVVARRRRSGRQLVVQALLEQAAKDLVSYQGIALAVPPRLFELRCPF